MYLFSLMGEFLHFFLECQSNIERENVTDQHLLLQKVN